jgi:acyl-coenzyme A synthetase/AMP-(fatty) acid ligase/thioesterase domain-containing protein/acyl carrier protein
MFRTAADPKLGTFLDAFAAAVQVNPDAVAASDGVRSITYGDADRLTGSAANLLAERLHADDHTGAGVGPVPGGAAVPVGLMAGHDVGSVLGILSIVKAGRLIVVLDAHLPEARLRHVAELAGVVDIVADAEHQEVALALVPDEGTVLSLETLLADAGPAAAGTQPIPSVPGAERTGDDPFVIIFTSGSTGMPKGVTISQRQLLVDVGIQQQVLRFGPGDRLIDVMPHSFAAGWGVVVAGILLGATLHIIDARDTGAMPIVQLVADEQITNFASTPHLVRAMSTALEPTDTRLKSIRSILTVGEAITGPDITAIRTLIAEDAVFYNSFGSSETLSISVNTIPASENLPAGPVPAGEVVPGKSVRIVREDGTAAALGDSGQLVVVSDAVTLGYWGAPEVTATRAGVDPDGTPTWNQGDLARFDADGQLTLLGRADDAVKVRGYLVEPSEIEAAIRRIDSIHETIVIAVKTEGAATRLVAYVVPKAGRRTLSPAAIRRALREELPSYMVPAAIVPMVALPRTERGKVDRAALPTPPAPGTAAPVSPVSDTTSKPEPLAADGLSELVFDQWELVVAQIWLEVLGLSTLGPDDDFTELGGDSLSAEEMLALVQERVGVDLRSSDLLQNPTVRSFTKQLRTGVSALPTHPDIVKLADGEPDKTVFCVAGGGALALTFLPMSRRLSGYNVYALHQHGLERRMVPDWSVHASARRNVELIRVVQPTGPYVLIGHSFGGLVALEMASILTEAGEEVDHLVILDAYLPRTNAEKASLEFGRLPEAPKGNTALAAVGKAIDRQVRRVLPSGFSQLKRVNARLRAYGAGVFRWEGQKHFDAFFDQAVLVTRRYELPHYSGRTTFVMADNNPDGPAGWTEYLTGEVTTTAVLGEHSSILREPHVAELAATVRRAIEGEPEPTPSRALVSALHDQAA